MPKGRVVQDTSPETADVYMYVYIYIYLYVHINFEKAVNNKSNTVQKPLESIRTLSI